jgi:hypothetical protein
MSFVFGTYVLSTCSGSVLAANDCFASHEKHCCGGGFQRNGHELVCRIYFDRHAGSSSFCRGLSWYGQYPGTSQVIWLLLDPLKRHANFGLQGTQPLFDTPPLFSFPKLYQICTVSFRFLQLCRRLSRAISTSYFCIQPFRSGWRSWPSARAEKWGTWTTSTDIICDTRSSLIVWSAGTQQCCFIQDHLQVFHHSQVGMYVPKQPPRRWSLWCTWQCLRFVSSQIFS